MPCLSLLLFDLAMPTECNPPFRKALVGFWCAVSAIRIAKGGKRSIPCVTGRTECVDEYELNVADRRLRGCSIWVVLLKLGN